MYDMSALYQAQSVQDAIRLRLEHPEAQIIAGGTDVLVQMREGKRQGQRQRDRPAPEGKRKRRDVVADRASDNHVAGPEQGRERQEDVGMMESGEHGNGLQVDRDAT